MKYYVRFMIEANEGFDITCTHFEFRVISGLISVWNGVLDLPHLFEASHFMHIDLIKPEEVGTDLICYNNISAALRDFNIQEVG